MRLGPECGAEHSRTDAKPWVPSLQSRVDGAVGFAFLNQFPWDDETVGPGLGIENSIMVIIRKRYNRELREERFPLM